MPRQNVNAFTSLGRSVEAYQPYYAPPVTPQTDYIMTGNALAEVNSTQLASRWDQNSTPVSRAPRMLGIVNLFSYGTQIIKQFRMVGTGVVESSQFQPRLSHLWNGEFNNAIWQAGYPRNLGLTVKVPTVNQGINPPWSMAPAPQYKRNVFVNRRAVTSGVKGVPAIPTNGQYS